MSIEDDIATERAKQFEMWGYVHDVMHTDDEWRSIIIAEATEAADFRQQLVKVAAVAMTALTVIDASAELYQTMWER